MRIRNTDHKETIELQMTSMIDVVFQLLAFFVLTFQITVEEGDFNIKMPLSAPREGLPDDQKLPPMVLRLEARGDGVLSLVRLNERSFPVSFTTTPEGETIVDEEATFGPLRTYIVGIVGEDRGPGSKQDTLEVEIDADYRLHYEHVIQAITSVAGYPKGKNDVEDLIQNIKFAPPRKPADGG